jgi:hypothetical protein
LAFKTVDQMLKPDPRYTDLCVLEAWRARTLSIADHHAAIADIVLTGEAPHDIRDAFDRARNILLYAWFDYDLLAVSESQAFGAFELALKRRLNGNGARKGGALVKLINEARERGVLPAPTTPSAGQIDPIEALRHMRNELAHGTSDVHSPSMALDAARACANAIDLVFPPIKRAP